MTDAITPLPEEFERRDRARDRVLAALRAGPKTSAELNEVCYRYSGRIMELRREGHVIRARREGKSLWRYELAGPGPAAATPLSDGPSP